jgi:hypothetical protein
MGGLMKGSRPPKYGSLDGGLEWDCHIFTSNWRELRTVVETLKREEVVFNKPRGMMLFYFTDNEVTYNICKEGLTTHFSPTA